LGKEVVIVVEFNIQFIWIF